MPGNQSEAELCLCFPAIVAKARSAARRIMRWHLATCMAGVSACRRTKQHTSEGGAATIPRGLSGLMMLCMQPLGVGPRRAQQTPGISQRAPAERSCKRSRSRGSPCRCVCVSKLLLSSDRARPTLIRCHMRRSGHRLCHLLSDWSVPRCSPHTTVRTRCRSRRACGRVPSPRRQT